MQEPHTFEFRRATKEQSADIARLIMMAMTDECCLYFCGDGYGLEDFYGMMTRLVEREDSQYSFKNTLVAMDGDKVVGISVSYDGGKLHTHRKAFIESAKTILAWMMRHRQVNSILTPWQYCLHIEGKE